MDSLSSLMSLVIYFYFLNVQSGFKDATFQQTILLDIKISLFAEIKERILKNTDLCFFCLFVFYLQISVT